MHVLTCIIQYIPARGTVSSLDFQKDKESDSKKAIAINKDLMYNDIEHSLIKQNIV
jgi:hypothetical protein